jgi:hypothetical protein
MFARLTIISILAMATAITATLDPATFNTKDSYPSAPGCARTSPSLPPSAQPPANLLPAIKTSKAIQAAECSHNTRTWKQTFAVFTQDHQYDGNNGAPYGACEAYNCAPGSKMATKTGTWTFFWDAAGVKGKSSGDGAGCIKSSKDGSCGCENSDGTFVYGGSNCK